MGGCGSVADKEQLAQDLDRIAREKAEEDRAAALKATEYELRLQTDDGDLAIASVRAYGLETAGTLLARQAERLGLPVDGLELEFSNERVPAECVLQEAGIMEGATVRVLGVPTMRLLAQKLVRTDADIRAAVRAWLSDPASAERRYGHIAKWNVKAVTDMGFMFRNARSFNEDLSGWDVSNVTRMAGMFSGASSFNPSSFNQDVSGWDVSSVKNMDRMFSYARSFNQDVSGWDVSNVTNMHSMFWYARSFNQDLRGWDVSNVTDMYGMFCGASSFDQDLSGWDVSNVTDMYCMFDGASSFNQDLSGWDVSNFTRMDRMFEGAAVRWWRRPRGSARS